MTNSAGIKYEQVHDLLMRDGLGPDEAMDHAAEYCKEITGRVSDSGTRRIRGMLNRVYTEALRQGKA